MDPHRAAPDRKRTSRRAGHSLVEVIVALVVFVVGLLGLELTLITLAREMRVAREVVRASEVAAARYERAAGGACGAASGTDRAGGVTSTWSVAPFAARAVVVSQEMRYAGSDGPRALRFEGVVGCR